MIKIIIKSTKYNSKIDIYYNEKNFDSKLTNKLIYLLWEKAALINKDYVELISSSGGRNIDVYKINYQNDIYYLKHYFYERISKKIQCNFIRKPEGSRNLKISNELIESGINTAEPIFGATKNNFITKDSLYLTKKAEKIELKKFLKKNEFTKEILLKLANFWAKFVNNNLIHQDPGFNNLFIDYKNDQLQITTIDIDDIYHLKFLPKKMIVHLLARFLAKTFINIYIYQEHNLLTERDVDNFIEVFIKNCNRDLDFSRFASEIKNKIPKKIRSRNKMDVYNSDIICYFKEKYN